jgi:hypothetical protein
MDRFCPHLHYFPRGDLGAGSAKDSPTETMADRNAQPQQGFYLFDFDAGKTDEPAFMKAKRTEKSITHFHKGDLTYHT